MDKAKFKFVQANQLVYVVKFVCCGVQANFVLVVFKDLKYKLSARTHTLFKDTYSFCSNDWVRFKKHFM